MSTQSKTMNCRGVSEWDMKQRVTPPGQGVPNKPLWQSSTPLPDPAQGCNSYLPNGQVMDRYTWTVQHLVASGERPSAALSCPPLRPPAAAAQAAAASAQAASTPELPPACSQSLARSLTPSPCPPLQECTC